MRSESGDSLSTETGGQYLTDVQDTYLRNPWNNGDGLDQVSGVAMAGGSLVLEGPDRLWSLATGQSYSAPRGIGGRVRRDMGLLFSDVPAHPLRAVGDAWRIVFSDVPLDIGDALLGFHQHNAAPASQQRVRMMQQDVVQAVTDATAA